MIFYVFTPIWGRFPFWLIFFQMGLKPPTRNPGLFSGRKFPVGPPRPTSRWMWTSNCAPIVTRWAFLMVVPVIPLKWKGSPKKTLSEGSNFFQFGPSIWEWYVKGRATEQLKRKTQKPRHPKTSWEGIWTPKTYLHTFSGDIWMSRGKKCFPTKIQVWWSMMVCFI